MATIVTRSGKGAALTHAEMDANFTNLNNELANVSLGVLPANSVSPTELQDSGDFTMNTLTTTGTVTTGSHILPTSNNAVDLGSPTKMWRDIYVGPGSLYVNGVKLVDSDASAINLTTDAASGQEIFLQPDGHLRLASTAGDVIVQSSNTLKVDTLAGATGALIANDVPALSFSTGTNNLKLSSSKLSRAAGNMEIETALGGGEYVHIETNDLYVGNFASALKITDATISAAPTNGNVTIAPDGTGELRVDAETEIHSSKGLIIHNGAQGDYLDLTGAGSDYGPIYGTGVAVEAFGAAPTLTMFAHKANGAGTYPNIWVARSRDDGAGNKDFLNNNDKIFGFFGAGWDQVSGGDGTFAQTAFVEIRASEDHSNTAGGGKVVIGTTNRGTTPAYNAATEKLTIANNIELNTNLDVNGQQIVTTSNGDIELQPDGTGTTYIKAYRVNSSTFADMPQMRRQGTSHTNYSLEVSNDSTSTNLTAGQPGGCFGFTQYSDNYTNPAYGGNAYYVGSINAVVGDEGTFGSAGENNNAIRLYTYQDQNGFGLNNVGEFRYASASFMKEKLKFSYNGDVTIETPTANEDLVVKASGTGNVVADAPFVLKSYTTTERNSLTAVAGMMIFNSSDSKAQVYDGSAWQNLHT